MDEPLTAVPSSNAEAGTSGDAAQGSRIARSETADLLFLQGPARLDRVEVVRVGWQVEDANAAGGAERSYACVVVGRQVVEYQHVATAQLGEQLSCQPLDEAILVRAGEHRGEEDPTGEAHRAEQGEVLAPVHGRALDE